MTTPEEARDRLVTYLAERLRQRFERYKAVSADLWRAFGTSPDDTEEDRRRMLGPRPGERDEQEEWAEFLEGVDMVQFVNAELWPPSDQLSPRSKEERERRAAELVDKITSRSRLVSGSSKQPASWPKGPGSQNLSHQQKRRPGRKVCDPLFRPGAAAPRCKPKVSVLPVSGML
jgi:hypothetical protein